MTLVRFNPNRALRGFTHDFDSMFNSFFRTPASQSDCDCGFMPRADIVDEKDAVKIDIELPGMTKDDIKVTIENDILTISGERKAESRQEDKNYIRTERAYGSFSRSFTLSDEIDTEKINADYKNGILSLTLTKQEKAKPKEISVEIK
jgi:HSP20 family protein